MIQTIALENFRQFANFQIKIEKPTLIIYGNNTKGKTSILEAIYFLFTLKSPWSIHKNDLIKEGQNYLRIKAQISDKNSLENKTFELFQDSNRRILKINDIKVPSKNFTKSNVCTIFTPEQIELLIYLPQKRRSFLDSIISKYNFEYVDHLNKYQQLLKHRNSYLKYLKKRFLETKEIPLNNKQLEIWTLQIIPHLIYILKERSKFITEIQKHNVDIEYQPLGLENFSQKEFLEKTSKKQQEIIRNLYQENSSYDIAVGHSKIGIHKDDWKLKHKNFHNIKGFGSRGEKRVAIANLILQTQEILKNKFGYYPILLLDDISAELDTQFTKKLLNKENINKQQTIITTIKLDTIPKDIQENAQIIHLD